MYVIIVRSVLVHFFLLLVYQLRLYWLVFITMLSFLNAYSDSLTKGPNRFLNPTLYFSSYNTTESRPSSNTNYIDGYSFSQNNVGGFMPLYTNSHLRKDSISKSTLHVLTTASVVNARLNFNGSGFNNNIEFYRISVGGRVIYNIGKNVFFATFTPFVSHDAITIQNPTLRWTGSIVYNRTVSELFSYRIGIARSFLLGLANPFTLNGNIPIPLVGVRIGRLDGVYLNLTFPRFFALNFPMGTKVYGSLFSRPFGAVYNYNNRDSTLALKGQEIIFGRSDWISGFSMNYRPHKSVSFFLSTGLATNRYIYFDEKQNFIKDNKSLYRSELNSSIFLEAGIALRLGKVKSVYNNNVMYDLFDINNLFDPGDLNNTIPGGDIPTRTGQYGADKLHKIQYKEVKELILEEL